MPLSLCTKVIQPT